MEKTALGKPLIIYHGACRDGFCAAWIAWRFFERARDVECEFFAAHYQQDPPDVTDREVYILDFSYKRPVLEEMIAIASSITMLDHHQSAEEDLRGLGEDGHTVVQFDMKRSGAMLAWDYWFSGEQPPWLVRYVQDRDLWTHKLAYTREVSAFISTLPFDFEAWEARFSTEFPSEDVVEFGRAIVWRTDQYVRQTSKLSMRVTFEGHNVPIVNAPYMDISELLNFLREDEKFAIGWHQTSDGLFKYSLRSADDGIDVSTIAKKYGGGGHRNAAGFTCPVPIHLNCTLYPVNHWSL